MSRVHDALRRAEHLVEVSGETAGASDALAASLIDEAPPALPGDASFSEIGDTEAPNYAERVQSPVPQNFPAKLAHTNGIIRPDRELDLRGLLPRCRVIPFKPAPEAHLLDTERPYEEPAEEFRSLRTRLNHIQSQQELRSIVITSASPAEGKTFTAVNLALAQAQLESPVLLADLDLRRPVVHNLFQCDKTPGFSDFVLGEKPLDECIRRIDGTNLFVMPAGGSVKNPLELLNMRQVKHTLDQFRSVFRWVILDTPPLLFSADANLLATLTDGTLIVVRIGTTTYDSVIRAMQTLCENNVLGIVANGARAGELYSKYTYYYSRSDNAENPEGESA